MSDAGHFIVYGLVYPVCFVFAYRNVFGLDLRANVLIWSVPMVIGNYTLWGPDVARSTMIRGMAATWALFVAFVYLAVFVDRWLRRRRGIGEPD